MEGTIGNAKGGITTTGEHKKLLLALLKLEAGLLT